MPNPRVLLIDDDDLVAVALYGHLLANDVSVDLATGPDEAQELMRANSYALVVIDAYLTGVLHGRATELLESVCRLCPGARIILLTAYGSSLLRGSTAANREITVVAKPQPVSYLSDVIGGFLQP